MERNTVFTKTAKGITQVNQKSASLSKDLMKVLKAIDGKSNYGQLIEKLEMDKAPLEIALTRLVKDGFARIFETRKEEPDPFAAAEDDFDFTTPRKAPAATQRVIASSANDVSELVRQQEKSAADRKSKEQAHEAARVKARTELETRAKLEAEAKAKAEAEMRAMEQARRAREAAERARIELEAKLKEEEARKRQLAEQKAKLTAEQKAKEEEEGRRISELRAKAEAEAKALSEARAKAEAEAKALAEARAKAEVAAKKQAEEASFAEKEMKARLKDEIEARIRSEMEELLRNEIEGKTRAELEAEIMAEAKMAAKAELEERLREEREVLAKAESEARKVAEREAREAAQRESKLRAEAEARAESEAAARAKAEEELRKSRRMEARAREEAEARSREQQEAVQRLEAERRAKIEAEARAMVEAEERERRERELQETIESERRAKKEAEERARIEARARATVEEDTRAKVQKELEEDLGKKAEIEGRAQARAYMEAKAKAEVEEDERIRADQARKAREIADVLRTRVEPDEVAPAETPVRRRKRRGNLLRTAVIGVLVLIFVGVGLLHVVPLRGYANKVERTLSGWMHDDVSITSLKFALFPTPHLKVEGVSVGKQLDAKAVNGRVHLDIGTLFGDRLSIRSLELEGVTLTNEAVRRVVSWGAVEGKAQAGSVETIRLKNVKIDVSPPLDPFEANLDFTREGALSRAMLTGGGRWTMVVVPSAEGLGIDFSAHDWSFPPRPSIQIDGLSLKGTLTSQGLVVPEFEATTMDGKVSGTLKATWTQGVRVESNLAIARMRVDQLVSAFTRDIAITGRFEGNFQVAAEAPTVEKLFAAPRVQGRFKVTDGSISNVDLVAVMQSEAAGSRAGVTKFAELTGEYGAAEQRAAFRQVNLQGGVLRGNGAVDIGSNSALSGRVALEIRSQVAQDRGAFSVSGTVSRPIIRRGG